MGAIENVEKGLCTGGNNVRIDRPTRKADTIDSSGQGRFTLGVFAL